MGWVLAETKTAPVSVALARIFRDMKPIDRERSLKLNRLQKLHERIKTYGALPFRWQCARIVSLNETVRINGQHSSYLITQHPELITDKMVVLLDEYICDTEEDVANLYSQIDSSDSARTQGEINISTAASVGLGDCDKYVVNLSITALSMEKWGDSYRNQLKEARAILIKENSEFVRFFDSIKSEINSRQWTLLRRVPVVRAILATWRIDVDACFAFWLLVAKESAPEASDPSRRLARHLATTTVAGGGRASRRGRGVVGAESSEII